VRYGRTLLACCLLALTACGSASPAKAPAQTTASPTPHTTTVNGTVSLKGTGNFTWDFVGDSDTETTCYGGRGGYSDIKPGASVVVTNESGTTIAVGSLGPATATISGTGRNAVGDSCDFTFAIPDVPDAKFYGVQVSHRGVVQFSPSELGDIALTLGD
jgi:hypothetical protein